jgi:hypothetical protein
MIKGQRRPTKAERAERRAEAYKLYAQRKSYREIGSILGVNYETARQDVLRAIKEATMPDVEEQIKKDLALLDQNLDIASRKYLQTEDPKDFEVINKILDMRAKMLGSYAPSRIESVVHQVSQEDLELQQILREAKAKKHNEVENA